MTAQKPLYLIKIHTVFVDHFLNYQKIYVNVIKTSKTYQMIHVFAWNHLFSIIKIANVGNIKHKLDPTVNA